MTEQEKAPQKGGRPPIKIEDELFQSLVLQHYEGMSLYKLAKIAGVSQATLKKYFLAAGVKVRLTPKSVKSAEQIIAPGVIGIPQEEVNREQLKAEHEEMVEQAGSNETIEEAEDLPGDTEESLDTTKPKVIKF